MTGKIEKKIFRTVRETIALHRMFENGDRVLLAVSGGPDSVTLATVIHTLAAEYCLELAVAHLNHGLRQEDSDRDAEFAAVFARKLQVPFYAEKKDLAAWQQNRRFSPEEAARRMRYEFLDAVAKNNGFNKIAFGHHADDSAELVLMNLLRGSGPLGLSGIAAVRDGKIVRPLIGLKRAEIMAYVAEKKLPYVVDASNTDPRFLRNRIRHHLIPELQNSYNPKITDTLNRLGTILQAENRWLEEMLQPVFERCVLDRQAGKISLSIARLNRETTAVRRRIVRKAILWVHKDLRRMTLFHIDAVLQLAEKGPLGGRLNLPAGIRVKCNRGKITVVDGPAGRVDAGDQQPAPLVEDYQYRISPGRSLIIRETGAVITLSEIQPHQLPVFDRGARHLAFFDMDCLQFPLVVRNFRAGDRFSPLGVDGSQKVKKYFNNHKVPAAERKKCPLVLSQGKIIWVAGHRLDNDVKVGPGTRCILKAELFIA